MNYSNAIFLISDVARAIVCTYEAGDNAPRSTFKSLDPSIEVDDLVIVPTDTRHKMTVVKVVAVDVEPNFHSGEEVRWIIGKVDGKPYEKMLAQESAAIERIKKAERRRERDKLRETMLADLDDEERKALPSFVAPDGA